MPKHIWSKSVRNDLGGTVLADTLTITKDAEENFADTVSAGGDKEIDLAITKANIGSFFLESDQAVTVKINSDTAPSQTITLAAKVAYAWNEQEPTANPLSGNITKLFFHNAGAVAANVKGGFLVNQGV